MADSTKNMFAQLAVKGVKEKEIKKEKPEALPVDKVPEPNAPSMSNILQQCLSRKDDLDLTPLS